MYPAAKCVVLQARWRGPGNITSKVLPRVVAISLAIMSFIAIASLFFLHRRIITTTSTLPQQISSIPYAMRAPREKAITRYEGYEFQPSISPGGDKVAFVWNGTPPNFAIYVKRFDNENALRLTNGPGHDLHPTWSPDGHNIAFLRLYPDHRKELFTVLPLGGTPHFISRNHASRPMWAQDSHVLRDRFPGPAWSPDGKYLAISDRQSDSDPDSIVFVALGSPGQRQFSFPARSDVGDYSPCFSPDGQNLAFIRVSTLDDESDIYVQPLSRSGPAKRITFDHVAIDGVAWISADELVFPSDHQDGPRLWKVNMNGGEPSIISGVRGDIGDPSASHDGRSVIYSEWFRNSNIWRAAINRTSPAGVEPAKWIGSSAKNDSASYSPDGRRIAFVSDRSGKPEVWTAMADGSHVSPIVVPKGRSIGTPRWSPDGQTIAFDTDLNRHSTIETISVNGGEAKVFMGDAVNEYQMPSWSRDGRYIYYSVAHGGTALQIWKKPVNGGEPLQITQHDGGDRAESQDGTTLFYDKRPGIWQVPVYAGQERPVPGLANVSVERLFWVGKGGIYYSSTQELPWKMSFFNLSSKQISRVAIILSSPEFWTPSLSLSPDEKWMLYTQTDQSGADLRMLQDFR